jgi:hypothetical protein
MTIQISEWGWRTLLSLPIPNGKVGSNTGGWQPSVTNLYFSSKNDAGADKSSLLRDVVAGSYVTIIKATDSTIFGKWKVSKAEEKFEEGYFDYTVVFIDQSGDPGTSVCSAIFADSQAGPTPYIDETAKPPRDIYNPHDKL